MGFKDSIMNILNVTDADDDYDDEDYAYEDDEFDDEAEDDAPKKPKFGIFTRNAKSSDDNYDDDEEEDEQPVKKTQTSTASEASQKKTSKVVQMKHSTNLSKNVLSEICMMKPKDDYDAQECIEELKINKTIILNLDSIPIEVSQHIFDFISGASYAMGCNFETIAANVYIFSPAAVELTGAFPSMASVKKEDPYLNNMSSFRTKYDN